MRIIYYILYERDSSKENSQKDWVRLSNERYSINILKINPYKFSGICGQRAHEVYIDSEFQKTKTGKEIIDEVFRPLAAFDDSYISYI